MSNRSSSRQPGPQGQGMRRSQAGPTPANSPLLTDEDARRIVEGGDAALLVERARELGSRLDVSPTQLRRFFGEVKRIEMLWAQNKEGQARWRAHMLEPRLTSQKRREIQVGKLQEVVSSCLKFAVQSQENFQRFADFCEALIAYSPVRSERR